jgi:hypothetical protein
MHLLHCGTIFVEVPIFTLKQIGVFMIQFKEEYSWTINWSM